MSQLFVTIDPILIIFYRITGFAFIDFLLGTFILACMAVIVGELTISALFLINRKHIEEVNAEILRYQNLSFNALSAGNKEIYKTANKLANDAFGRSFFLQIALSAGFLWPAFFVMLWMSYRFSDIQFDFMFTGREVGFICPFIALFAAAYLIFKRIKYKIPYFNRVKAILNTYNYEGPAVARAQTTTCRDSEKIASGS